MHAIRFGRDCAPLVHANRTTIGLFFEGQRMATQSREREGKLRRKKKKANKTHEKTKEDGNRKPKMGAGEVAKREMARQLTATPCTAVPSGGRQDSTVQPFRVWWRHCCAPRYHRHRRPGPEASQPQRTPCAPPPSCVAESGVCGFRLDDSSMRRLSNGIA